MPVTLHGGGQATPDWHYGVMGVSSYFQSIVKSHYMLRHILSPKKKKGGGGGGLGGGGGI